MSQGRQRQSGNLLRLEWSLISQLWSFCTVPWVDVCGNGEKWCIDCQQSVFSCFVLVVGLQISVQTCILLLTWIVELLALRRRSPISKISHKYYHSNFRNTRRWILRQQDFQLSHSLSLWKESNRYTCYFLGRCRI